MSNSESRDHTSGDRAERSSSDRHRSSRHRSRSRERSSRHDDDRRGGGGGGSSRRDDYDDDRRGGSGGSSRRDDYRGSGGGGGGGRHDDYGRGGGGGSDYRGDYRSGGGGNNYSSNYRGRGGDGGGGGYGGGGRGDDRRDGGRDGRGKGGIFEGFGDQGRRSPTPEDTIPISKRVRRVTAWDVKPVGFENYTAEQAKLTGLFSLPGQVRPQSQSFSGPSSFNANGTHENPPLFFRAPLGAVGPGAPIGSLARQSRRLYVGNITTEATEEAISAFFNGKMREMNLLSDGGLGEDLMGLGLKADEPVISVHLNYEKNYAFVEFRNPQEATSATAFDGIIFQNNALKIRRPKDYVGDESSAAPHVPGVVSTNVPDTVNKIFVGGLPSYLNDDQVMELLKSFGELRSFNLVKEGGTGNSKGFAFCEYVDPLVTEIACEGLNGMELGDRFLVVQRAALGASSGNGGSNTGGGTGDRMQGQHRGGNDFNAGPSIVTAPSILAAAAGGDAVPTRVLQMLNMVAVEELTNDEDFKEIMEDIKEECGKFGTVEEVKIPRPVKTEKGRVDIKESESVKDLGKVFVLFENEEQTTKALRAIAGRQFGGRLIICAYASEETFLDFD